MRKLILTLVVLTLAATIAWAGEAIQLRNNSTIAMPHGMLVKLGTRNMTAVPATANSTKTGILGSIVAGAGQFCARTAVCWVCTDGMCDVLKVKNATVVMGQIVRMGIALGRADVNGTSGGANQTIGYTVEQVSKNNRTVRVLMRVN